MSSSKMTVHSPLLNDVPVGKGRYSYQTYASLVGMVYCAATSTPRNRRFPEIKRKANLTVFSYSWEWSPWMEAAAEKSRSATVLDIQGMDVYNLY